MPIDTSPRAAPLTGRTVAGALIGVAAAAGISTAAVPLNIAPTPFQPSLVLGGPGAGAGGMSVDGSPYKAGGPSARSLYGAEGMKAPSIGGSPPIGGSSMPSTRNPAAPMSGGLPRVGGGLPRVGGGGGAASALAEVGIPLLAAGLAKAAAGENPLDIFKSDPLDVPFSPEAQREAEQFGRDAAADREKKGNNFRQFGDFLQDPTGAKKRQELERQGNKFRAPIRKGDGKALPGTVPGVPYEIKGFVNNGVANTPFLAVKTGPIGSLVTEKYKDPTGEFDLIRAFLSTGSGPLNLIENGVVKFGADASISSVKRVDGTPDPTTPASPESFKGGEGLVLPTTNSDSPVLPNTGLNKPAPTRSTPSGSPTIPIRPDTPLPSAQPASSPTTQPQPNPQATSPVLPALPSPLASPSPGLPSIPSAPTTGSASPSTATPTQTSPFPSPFTETPGVRNQEALKPTEPDKPEPPKKPQCADPCMAEAQNDAKNNKPISIVVKVFKSCKISGGTTTAPSGTPAPATPATPASGTTTTTTGSGGTTTTSTTSSGTVSNPVISDGIKAALSGGTPPFQSETVQEGNALFETKSIKVPAQEADNYKLLYDRIAKLEAQHCDQLADGSSQAIAAIPEWWQVRIGADRPQLVVLYAEKKEDGKLGRSRYAMTLPHYNKPQNFKPTFPSYKKGQWEGLLTLKDNSKLIINAATPAEATGVLNALKTFIDPKLLEGSFIKIGERKGQELLKINIVPVSARFFPSGQKDTNPDWVKDLRK